MYNILLEATYNQATLLLSRELFNAVKTKKKSYKSIIEIRGIDVEVVATIKYDKKLKWAYDINADSGDGDIAVNIVINPEFFPMAYNNLNAELKEMFRHEIEHVAQQNFEGKAPWDSRDETTYEEYLLLSQEVPAYVYGLYKRAKTKRIPLDMAFEEFYNDMKHNFTSKYGWTQVKKVWTDYAKKNIKTAIWSDGE